MAKLQSVREKEKRPTKVDQLRTKASKLKMPSSAMRSRKEEKKVQT
jgi:hypothetical protein